MKKQFFLVLGLPRSGSTLLTNLINSQDNVFCVSEPLWEKRGFGRVKTYGKLKIKENLDINEIPLRLKEELIKGDYNFGGYKETFRYWQFDYMEQHINEDLDFIIRISRDPVQNFGSWKKKKQWGIQYNSVQEFAKCYNELMNFKFKKIYDIQYEKILSEGISYLNKVLPIKFSTDKLNPYHFSYGDSVANSSKKIIEPIHNNNVNDDEIKYLKKNINDKSFVF